MGGLEIAILTAALAAVVALAGIVARMFAARMDRFERQLDEFHSLLDELRIELRRT